MVECASCGKEVPENELERKHQLPGGKTINGVQEAEDVGVCSECNDEFREQVAAANDKLSEPNGEQH